MSHESASLHIRGLSSQGSWLLADSQELLRAVVTSCEDMLPYYAPDFPANANSWQAHSGGHIVRLNVYIE